MKHTNRLVSLLLAVVIICSMIPFPAHAAATSGTCGDSVNWKLSSGTLTISGTGPMTNFSYTNVPWYESRDSIKKVVIQSGVTTVGNYAFYC